MKHKIDNILFFLAVLIFSISTFGHGVSDADKHTMLQGGLLEYALMGAKHMVTGYDHLLFIFGVIFFLTRFGEIVKFITAFTLGHSITLIFATFLGVAANPYLIDAVIALTVVYKGFDNIDGFRKYLKISPPNMLALVFIFGLIHGFGLSTRLQELPLNHSELLAEIIAFNVGVEFGQIAALSVMMFFLTSWRKTISFSRFSFVSNLALIGAGLILLIIQIRGYIYDHDHHEDTHHLEMSAEPNMPTQGDPSVENPVVEEDNPKTQQNESEQKPIPKKHSHKHRHGDHVHEH